MDILVAQPFESRLLEYQLGQHISYCPTLENAQEEGLRQVLIESQPDVAIVNRTVSKETLLAWRDSAKQTVQLIQIIDPTRNGHTRQESHLPQVKLAYVEQRATAFETELAALGLAERSYMQHQTAERLAACGISPQTSSPSPSGAASLSGSKAILVGAGIINLMVARTLLDRGADVEIIDAGPDPRTKPDWRQLGATHGGGDARMFCFTEADNYNEKGNVVYSDMKRVMSTTIRNGGWLAIPPEQMTMTEQVWLRNHCTLPSWMAEIFTEDIHHFNMASCPLWEQLQDTASHLFNDVQLTQGVLRLYSQPEKVVSAQALHSRLGSLKQVLDVQELCDRHPTFRPAVAKGEIAGALEIKGFTLSIHRFTAKLLQDLETRGAQLRWNLPATHLERNTNGEPCGIQTPVGLLEADHYVLSPGAYGNLLLQGTRSSGKVQGILGLWLNLPNLSPQLQRSIKIHREGHVGEDSNVTVGTRNGEPTLMLGSGYGFIGNHSLNMESPEIDHLFQALEVTAGRFFPQAYEQAVRAGTLYGDRKACIRPFTSTGLGIFEVLRTETGGRMVIATGHNTGGFTQAPIVAEAVADTLAGVSHPMQALYDPDRGMMGGQQPESTADRRELSVV